MGTKAAAHYRRQIRARRSERRPPAAGTPSPNRRRDHSDADFDRIFEERIAEADEFYRAVVSARTLSDDAQRVQRQALRRAAVVASSSTTTTCATGWRAIPAQPPPPPERRNGRNNDWTHLYNADVISMPDKWEYPWYAAWDLAFHCVPLALVDPDFAKEQLILLLREWYMHPNGQLPAYEWAFSDVNPPVHAWAAWRVYKIEQRSRGARATATSSSASFTSCCSTSPGG